MKKRETEAEQLEREEAERVERIFNGMDRAAAIVRAIFGDHTLEEQLLVHDLVDDNAEAADAVYLDRVLTAELDRAKAYVEKCGYLVTVRGTLDVHARIYLVDEEDDLEDEDYGGEE